MSGVEQEGRHRARLQTDVQLFHRLKKAGVSSAWRERDRGVMKQKRKREHSCRKEENRQMERVYSKEQGREQCVKRGNKVLHRKTLHYTTRLSVFCWSILVSVTLSVM